MARGKATDPELVAQVQAALLAGMAVNEAARQYNLPPASVSGIRANLGSKFEQVRTESRVSIDEMLARSLDKHLQALEAIASLATDKDYLRHHTPENLAVLHERFEGHSLRLLEAAGLAAESEESTTRTA